MKFPRHSVRIAITIMVVAICAAVSGCGQKTAPGEGASLTVTREFGNKELVARKVTPVTAGLTAMRQLQANVDVKTTYGGKFVNAIFGTVGSAANGSDWLFYVDGTQSDTGAASWRLKSGQEVQWDFHNWRDFATSEAIVGAYPRPLLNKRVEVVCKPASSNACAAFGKKFPGAGKSPGDVTVVIGTWDDIAGVKGVPDLTRPAIATGAFASFTGKPGARKLELLGMNGKVAKTLGAGGGLVAAARYGTKVVWVLTGVDQLGVDRAQDLLEPEILRNRFAAATNGTKTLIPLPVPTTPDP